MSNDDIPTLTSLWSPAYQTILEAAKPSYFKKHETLIAMGVAQTDRFELDRVDRSVRFVADSGIGIEASAQMLGSYEGTSGTWEWTWNHPDISDAWKQDARVVQQYGEAHGLAPLTTGMLECTFPEAWQLVIIAVHIVNADAAYGAPYDDAVVAFALRDLRPVNPRRKTVRASP